MQPLPRFQFEPSSGTPDYSQKNNCGPTGSTQQADFYRDRSRDNRFGIERTRTLAGVARGTPTSAWDQAEMLEVRGVSADVRQIDSLEQLDGFVGYGQRPVGIGVLMSRVTARTRGHSFLGWHRITILRRKRRFVWRRMRWIRGYIYTDPNFSALNGYRPDPKKGHRWISRAALRYAFINNSPRYAIVPTRQKAS